MTAYSFQPRFIEPIRQGYKRQTIRAVGLRPHVRVGGLIQLYTGMRTAHCARILPDVVCIDVQPCTIVFDDASVITRITTSGIPVRDLDAFAVRDGFTGLEDMAAFWAKHHGDFARFDGLLIEWAAPRETDALQVAAE
jgi:hypothetical protein